MERNLHKRIITLNTLVILALQMFAQGPNNSGTYYQAADGKKGAELKTAMGEVINPHTRLSYNALWEAFKTTDVRPDGKVWDMYSNFSNFTFGTDQDTGLGGDEGKYYNREHSMPKSWFGKNNENTPMYTDITHIVPTDKWVNSLRGNVPFGETDNPTNYSKNKFSKFGPSSINGYTKSVFEPNDEYKGDFARIYFYMVTCYEKGEYSVTTWESDMLANNAYPAFTEWAQDMLLRWANEDPVSQKEIDRNEAVYKLQGNRNPYVDYPGLEQYVWGEYTDKTFSYANYEKPDIPTDPEDPENPPVGDNRTFTKVTSENQLSPEYTYLIVYESGAKAIGATERTYRSSIDVTLSGNTVTTDVNGNGQPRAFILGGSNGAYTLYDNVEEVYLALNSSDNALHGNATATTDNEKWNITISDNTSIQNNAYPERYINCNPSANRFACYRTNSNQQPVALYRSTMTTGIVNITPDNSTKVDVYTITGMKIRSQVERNDAINGLSKGIYIIGNKKYLVK